jgi:hypothetical protein
MLLEFVIGPEFSGWVFDQLGLTVPEGADVGREVLKHM